MENLEYANAYSEVNEILKSISKEDILKFAESLDILSDEDRETLVNMTPASYIGKASELAKMK